MVRWASWFVVAAPNHKLISCLFVPITLNQTFCKLVPSFGILNGCPIKSWELFFGLSTNHASTRSRGLFLIAYRVSLRTSMSKWESVVYGAFVIYLRAQVRAGNSRLDYPPNHASTRSRGLLIIAYRVSLRTSMSKWWFAFYGLFLNRIWVDLPRACEGRACPKQFLIC